MINITFSFASRLLYQKKSHKLNKYPKWVYKEGVNSENIYLFLHIFLQNDCTCYKIGMV